MSMMTFPERVGAYVQVGFAADDKNMLRLGPIN